MAETNVNDVIEIAKEYLILLKKNNISFERAYLFGSFAKGNFREYSDLDLAIFAEEWTPDIIEAQMMLMRLRSHVDYSIEPHPFRLSDLEDPDPFVKEILKHGKLIMVN